MLSLTVPRNRKVSCSTMPTERRRCGVSSSRTLMPSMRTEPSCGGYRPWTRRAIVVLPLPLRPTMPTKLPRRQVERRPVEHALGAAVGKRHLVEGDRAAHGRLQPALARTGLRRLVHDLAQHLHRERGLLELVDQRHDLHQRPRHAAGEHLERDQRADGHRPCEDVDRADRDDRDQHQLLHQRRQRARDGADLAHPQMHARSPARCGFPILCGAVGSSASAFTVAMPWMVSTSRPWRCASA